MLQINVQLWYVDFVDNILISVQKDANKVSQTINLQQILIESSKRSSMLLPLILTHKSNVGGVFSKNIIKYKRNLNTHNN